MRSSAPGCSTRCCARTPSPACCPGGTRRSPAGCSTRTAGRCPSPGGRSTPEALLREYGSDAVRYWAASARLGTDAAFDLNKLKVGRRLATKILNAGRFVLSAPGPAPEAQICEPVDRALLARLARVAGECSAALAGYDHARALELAERCFWFFCDDYLELVKARVRGERGAAGQASASTALRAGLSVLTRLLAPFCPFVTEEVWSWHR